VVLEIGFSKQYDVQILNTISSKDLQLLELIGRKPGATQREIAEKTGFSLGMVNLILRRLAKTGYIKVANLDRSRISYLLTPKAIAEKSRQSYTYLVRTIRIYEQYRERISSLLEEQLRAGVKQFAIHGEGDLADMVKVLLHGRGQDILIRHLPPSKQPVAKDGEVILHCSLNGDGPVAGISILEELLNEKAVIS
jgi:DNA-binding MarR family transcriptional regulator